jgi:hypothetical protein
MEDRPNDRPSVRPPMCPDCQTPMQFRTAEPSKTQPTQHLTFGTKSNLALYYLSKPHYFETMTNFDVTMAKFNRVASAACEDTHAPVAKHLQLIADSRELIAKIDKLLDRDRIFYGSSKPPAASAPANPD